MIAERRRGARLRADRAAAPGSISRPSSRPSTTCCRRTISRRPRVRWWPAAPRPPTSASTCCRSSRRATSAGSAWPAPSTASKRRLDTIDKMERPRGHLYNWYETRTSIPCTRSTSRASTAATSPAIWSRSPRPARNGPRRRPFTCRAISTACSTPSPSSRRAWTALPDDRRQLRPLRKRLRTASAACAAPSTRSRTSRRWRPSAPSTSPSSPAELRKLANTIHHETDSPRSEELAGWAAKLEATCEAHVSDAHSDQSHLAELRDPAGDVARACAAYMLSR